MRRLGWIFALVAVTGVFGGRASAAPLEVTGGTSTLTFTVDLDALDVDVTNNGNAEMTGPGVIVLRITGGAVDLPAVQGSIQHENSGLAFDFGSVTIDADNLEFDFDDLQVKGDLSAGPIELHTGIFNIVVCSEGGCVGPGGSVPTTGYGLFLRAQAADFFENNVFGDVVFDDEDQIIFAETQPTFAGVPEPELLTLLGVALALAGVCRRTTSSQGA
jgi:hypothetical protein